MKCSISEYRWNDADLKRNTLRYSLCQAENVVEANRFAINKWYNYPRDTPNLDLFEKPIWTTWARFKESSINILAFYHGKIQEPLYLYEIRLI